MDVSKFSCNSHTFNQGPMDILSFIVVALRFLVCQLFQALPYIYSSLELKFLSDQQKCFVPKKDSTWLTPIGVNQVESF